MAYDDVCKARGRHEFLLHAGNWLVCAQCGYSQRKDQFPNEWPYNEFNLHVTPCTVVLVGNDRSPSGWSVVIYEMLTGRYGFRLLERTVDGEVERAASGAFDEPWMALRYAIGELAERLGIDR